MQAKCASSKAAALPTNSDDDDDDDAPAEDMEAYEESGQLEAADEVKTLKR
jgi:hypothetical protein